MLYLIVSVLKRVNSVGLVVFYCEWGKGCELSGIGFIVL
jgi:hypothetical protein